MVNFDMFSVPRIDYWCYRLAGYKDYCKGGAETARKRVRNRIYIGEVLVTIPLIQVSSKEGNMNRAFENLDMFQESRELTKNIYKITNKSNFNKDYGLREQIRRASVSILSNIAEGYERDSKKEFSKFLYYSKGSCGEVRAQLIVAHDLDYIDKEDYEALYNSTVRISGMIYRYIEYLKNSSK